MVIKEHKYNSPVSEAFIVYNGDDSGVVWIESYYFELE